VRATMPSLVIGGGWPLTMYFPIFYRKNSMKRNENVKKKKFRKLILYIKMS